MAVFPVEIIISFFTIFILVVATILSFYQFLQVRYKQFLYMTLNWFGIAIWLILTIASYCIKFNLIIPGIDTEIDIFSNLPLIPGFLSFYKLEIAIFSSPILLSHLLGLIGLFSTRMMSKSHTGSNDGAGP
ncbi:MAG: hypothetical protein ACXADY_13715 [Candidatus Hodarchaeales archaeon]|jgi:hypothetical protein